MTLRSVNVNNLLFSTYTHNLSVGLQDAVLPQNQEAVWSSITPVLGGRKASGGLQNMSQGYGQILPEEFKSSDNQIVHNFCLKATF
jgi:hypothetical protein